MIIKMLSVLMLCSNQKGNKMCKNRIHNANLRVERRDECESPRKGESLKTREYGLRTPPSCTILSITLPTRVNETYVRTGINKAVRLNGNGRDNRALVRSKSPLGPICLIPCSVLSNTASVSTSISRSSSGPQMSGLPIPES
jgi:hypothetical protein